MHFDLLALFVIAAAGLSIVWSTLKLGISPMPTSGKVREAMLALVPDTDGEVHELGAGWGTLAWALAEKLPNARVIAWEASPIPFAFCWLRAHVQRRPNLMLRFCDFHDADLRSARVITAYLWTGAMTRLARKFDAELPPGACVVTHTFAWPGKTPESTTRVDDLYRTPVYRYRSRPHGDT